jgi:hypothetical protein
MKKKTTKKRLRDDEAQPHSITLAIFTWREFIVDGALATYGIDRIDQYRRAPAYIDRSCS